MRAGFTTIEVVLALLVFSVGVVSLASGAAHLVRLDGDSWRRIAAIVAAENAVEASRASCPDSGTGLVVLAYTVPRAGRPPRTDTLSTYLGCD